MELIIGVGTPDAIMLFPWLFKRPSNFLFLCPGLVVIVFFGRRRVEHQSVEGHGAYLSVTGRRIDFNTYIGNPLDQSSMLEESNICKIPASIRILSLDPWSNPGRKIARKGSTYSAIQKVSHNPTPGQAKGWAS